MSEVDWKKFWASYRHRDIQSEEDLYFEVGKTVNGRPVSERAFQLSVDSAVQGLELSKSDRLLELCCGNGLMTRCFAPLVAEIEAVDFAEHLIEHAARFSAAKNVRYLCVDAVSHLLELERSASYIPSKVLLGDCLCYFEPSALTSMLRSVRVLTNDNFLFMVSGVPCDDLKWNFYNTPERIQRFHENEQRPGNTNDGIGRWWKREELEGVASDLGLAVVIRAQPAELSDFRVDAVFRSADRSR